MRRLALAILTAACWLLATCAVQSWKVRGEDETVCVVVDLNVPCVATPADMVWEAVEVVQCESRWDPLAVGRFGEKGLLQLLPSHAKAMSDAGLDWYNSEGDRWRWAVRLWERYGWTLWSCRPN